MKINVRHIAKLANLTLSDEEIKRFENQLEKTLTYISKLNEIKTDNVEITSQVTGLENVMDEDIPRPSFSQKEALKNASQNHNGFFVVKAILEE